MFRANNAALFQGANQDIISIRQAELQYYISVYQSFATQAALIGGFTYGVLQNTTRGVEWVLDLDFFYGLFATLTILTAVHVILCCLFLQVYGPGLSLYGPTGSMIKATEVLRKEQPMVVWSFVIMILFFVCSTVVLFWTVMDYLGAIICSAVLAVGVRYWWYYNRRIYDQLSWNGNEGNYGRPSEDESPADRLARQQQASGSSPFHQRDIELGNTNSSVMQGSASSSQAVLIEGYLTRKVLGASGKWERRYFVLTSKGSLLAMKDRKEWRDEAKSSLKERPIDLSDFTIVFSFEITPSSISYTNYPNDVKELCTQPEKKFFFYLQSKEKSESLVRKILFMSDTEEEIIMWKNTFLSLNIV